MTAVAIISALAGRADGQTITFRKVADIGTPIPNGTGTFTSLEFPAFDGGNAAFLAEDASFVRDA